MRFAFRLQRTPAPPPAGTGAGLGTFGGVYTPSILTILGVIMYLRFGWVVGNVGLIGALVIVTISTSITFLTALSISSIATDKRVRVGGAYHMISRSLGIETGGAVGLPLYIAQALSVALYTIGFAESLALTFPVLNQRMVAIAVTIGVALLALRSARAAIRAQYVIMALIALSLVSFFFGRPIESTELEMFGAPPRLSESFWHVFAVFFPAVTGIMAGVNMSGDLKNPARSIPIGTLAAVGTGFLIYMSLPIFLAMRADATTLIEDPLVMRRMALWGDAILLGVWGATLSSAVGSILAAPRVLQALARDGVLPRPLRFIAAGSGPNDEPRIGTLVTLGVALAAVMLGSLNVIAPILTMFFLATYLVLNVAAGLEGFLHSPSFRPAFRVHWSLPLLGAVGCLTVMFVINALATVIAAVLILGVYAWLERRGLRAAWGDIRRGVWMALVRAGLLRLGGEADPRNWRPHLLVLSGAPTRRWHLIDLADSLTLGRGLITVSSTLPPGTRDAERRAVLERAIHDHLARRGVQAFVRLVIAEDRFEGAEKVVQTYGLGPLVPNTILLGDSEDRERRERYCRMITAFHRGGRNVLILRHKPDRGFGRRRRIDLWWGGLQANGGLMLILAYLLRSGVEWRDAEVRAKLVVPTEAAAESARANLRSLVAQLRMPAHPEVFVAGGRSFREILNESSKDADLVLLGVARPDVVDDFVEYYEGLQSLDQGLPTTLFVLAAPGFRYFGSQAEREAGTRT